MAIFEYFYTEPIPQVLWNELVQNVLDPSKPKNLGAVGLLILQLLKDYEHEADPVATFLLLEGWHDKAIPLQPSHAKLPLRPNKTPRETLRSYFATLSEFEDLSIGGRELMVAMNEDVQSRDISENYIIAYNPGCFSFQLATGDGNMVTQAIHEEIKISDVLLGCGPEYGQKAQVE